MVTRQRPRPRARFDGALIREDIAARGWNHAIVASEAGLSRATVSLAVEGRRGNPRTIARIARVLGHTPERYLIREVREVSL